MMLGLAHTWICLLGLVGTGRGGGEPPLVYLPFDGDRQAIAGGGDITPVGLSSEGEFRSGLRGECAHVDEDYRFSTPGHFDVRHGTVAFWLRPSWKGADETGRSLFCLYGGREVKEPWQQNRWSIVAGSGRLRYWICGAGAGQTVRLEAPIEAWQPGQWHHVAATWTNLNGGSASAELCLYVDGRLVERRAGITIDVGPVSETFDVGRDSDASPDYADADFDEFYIYDRPLSGDEIRRAVELIGKDPAPIVEPAARGRWRSDWWNDGWPFRCRVNVSSRQPVGRRATVRLPLDLQSDLHALGLAAGVDWASVRVVPCDPSSSECPKDKEPLFAAVEPDAVCWPAPQDLTPGQVHSAHVYFDVIEYDASIPLFLRRRSRSWSQPVSGRPPSGSDYATDAYGNAWDFDEGDLESIDQWGNTPSCVRNRQVEDGVLSFDAWQDAYFIWGDMWGSGLPVNRPVSIDLRSYPVLKMKVRQSCPSSEWEIFARSGSPRLLNHKFRVTGQGWQVVRIDLAREARWGGVLDAFRIDPTSWIDGAHVEIDWIRLTNEIEAVREPVEILASPAGQLAALSLEMEGTQVRAGSRQTVTAGALDADGVPVCGQPVTVRLTTKSDGRLQPCPSHPTLACGPQARRGRTDEHGRLQVALVSSRTAGSKIDVVGATADFTSVVASPVTIDTLPGPPHHYEVSPTRAASVPQKEFPLVVHIQLADEHGNPLDVAGRRPTLSVSPGATLDPPRVVTDSHGRAQAALSVDAARRWVYRIEAVDEKGCSGRSAPLSVILDRPRSNPIRLLPNGYFAGADGRAFVPLGGFYANWVQTETSDGEWSTLHAFTDTTDAEKRRWMKFLRDNGATAMRLMLRTHRSEGTEPMDVCGRVNQPLLAEVVRYLDLAREFDLEFQLVLHEDYTKPVYFNQQHFDLFALPAFAEEDADGLPAAQRRFVRDRDLVAPISRKYTDTDVMACQDAYVRELLPVLRNNPQVFAYELENEMVDCPASWANHAIETIRAVDPATPVCVSHGGGGLATADPLWWHRNVNVDFYNFHLYPHGGTTSPEIDYGAAVSVLARYGRMCGPCFLGESAGDQFRLHGNVATRRWVMRDVIWMALTGGSPGVFFWNARGSEVREFRMAREALRLLDLTTWRRAKPEIGIDVRHPLDDDKWFRTDQGKEAQAMMGRYAQHYLSEGVDFDFTTTPADYEQSCPVDRFAPSIPKRCVFQVSQGWQLSYLARDDWREVLVYVRNFAGAEEWACDMGRHRWRQFLRRRTPMPLRMECLLPAGTYRTTIHDLDEQTAETRAVRSNEALDLGVTDHDFGLVLRADDARW